MNIALPSRTSAVNSAAFVRKRNVGKTTSPSEENSVNTINSHTTPTSSKVTTLAKKQTTTSKAVWTSLAKSIFLTVMGLTLAVRLFRLSKPAEVVFDEVHFGGFASHYLKREYYYDVHPPFGKMLIAGVGYFMGFDGSFRFEKIGLEYSKGNAPYIVMRLAMIGFGSGAISLALASLIEMGVNPWAVGFGGLLMAFDNALVSQTKFILLDAMLFFFIMASIWSWVKFKKQTNYFSLDWWKYLILTGSSIAGSIGVKMVGLFTVATIGIGTLCDLWQISSPKRGLNNQQLLRHFGARALCLIVLPIILYLSFFWVHLKILIKTGPGDGFMSSDFQSNLEGNALHSTSRQAFFGQTVRFKSKVEDVFLYSHNQFYPLHHDDGKVSSQGQQVTGYGADNEFSEWTIMPVPEQPIKPGEKRPLRQGSVFRLYHKATNKFLLTHDVASPLTMTNQEVTCMEDGKRVNETLFTLDLKQGQAEKIMTKASVFRIVHNITKVAITNQQENLPKWMPGHREINGDKRGIKDSSKWVISDILDPADESEKKEMGTRKRAKLSFFAKFKELQMAMLKSNSQLLDEHPFKSHPASWPFVHRGVAFWDKAKQARIYLLGNIVAWYIALVCLVALGLVILKESYFIHRGINSSIAGKFGSY
jgi:dolichyl-phosphate-mannose-protein mannosyltransferase